MFTICIAFFASLTASQPSDYKCFQESKPEIQARIELAMALYSHDPFSTLEVKVSGGKATAPRFYILVRRLEGV